MPRARSTRILIAAHTPGLAETLARTIAGAASSIALLHEPSAGELTLSLPSRVAKEKPALVLLELKQNADALAQLRFHDRNTPVVVMLTAARPEVAFLASRLGADEMLLMSNTDEEVAAAITSTLSHDRTPSPQDQPAEPSPSASSNEPIFTIGKRASLQAEAVAIRRTLQETNWNRKEAARRLQMSYKSLLNRLKAFEGTGQII
ncbi:MAG TPA: helix-turn-helix domain-containing protein [Acidobacteriaceae bacterium]